MTNFVQIPNLPAGIALNGTEQFEAVQAGVSVRLTAAQIVALVPAPVPPPFPSLVTLKTVGETIQTAQIIANVLTIDCTNGMVASVVVNTDINTFSIINAPTIAAITVYFTNDGGGHSQSGMATGAYLWPSNVPPVLTNILNAIDVITFTTRNGGASWFGFVCGLNYPGP